MRVITQKQKDDFEAAEEVKRATAKDARSRLKGLDLSSVQDPVVSQALQDIISLLTE